MIAFKVVEKASHNNRPFSPYPPPVTKLRAVEHMYTQAVPQMTR